MFQDALGTIESRNDINILLLGAAGVGKTTFINSLANYLIHDSLESAIKGHFQVVIPAWFTFMDNATFEEKTIIIGTPDDHEKKGGVGQSCTRTCRSFVFSINGRKLRLIDAPGIGDTEGLLQDEKNFDDILAYINRFKYLHGICILLKPNEERLSILFRFCVKELLRHLHVDAGKNLMFVFTNARSTFYQLGSSAPLLRNLLRTLPNYPAVEVPFSLENCFLFDNEAFRFLALCKNGVQFPPEEKQQYAKSWTHTTKEFGRLIERILQCNKHVVRDTVSLNEAQQLIRKLSRPIGEMARLIQENMALAQTHKDDVLKKKKCNAYALPQIEAEIVDLGHPRTVSTNPKHMAVVTTDGLQKIDYTSHCHAHCFLKEVATEVIGHEVLKKCAAMNSETGICNVCDFSWKEHMHITYEVRKSMTSMTLNANNNRELTAVDLIEQRIQSLRAEEKAIVDVCAHLTHFLRVNALNPINDDIFEYLEHFLREERAKKAAGTANDNVIAGLEQLLADYQRENKLIEAALKSTTAEIGQSMELQQIFMQVNRLYRLPITGAKIEQQVKQLTRVEDRFNQDREQTVPLPRLAIFSQLMCKLRSIVH